MAKIEISGLIVGIFLTAGTSLAVMVDGYCFLESESNHQGTQVLFLADTPSAETDTAYTDQSGYYQADLAIGAYDIFFTHQGFCDDQILDQLFAVNTTLSEVTLIIEGTHISGNLSGVLEGGRYLVTGTITIQNGNTLIIEPGASFIFNGDYLFHIYGELHAVGTENDSIIFMPAPCVSSWYGIYFDETSNDHSRLDYCAITGIYSNYYGDIEIRGANPTISHSSISNNLGSRAIRCRSGACPTITYCTLSDNNGHGIYCWDSNPSISNCTIMRNNGSGIACHDSSSPVITNCTISENSGGDGGGIYLTGDGYATIADCNISGNTTRIGSGGIMVDRNYNASIEDCTIEGNYITWSGDGSGISCYGSGDIVIRRCLIKGNSVYAWGRGVGIYCDANPVIENCTIVENTAGTEGVIYCRESSPTIINTVLANNTCFGGICFYGSNGHVTIRHDCFYNNQGGDFIGSHPLDSLGVIATTNVNGDSCDIYHNIFLDPAFVYPEIGDYHLLAESPCIDAGDPSSPLDPDSTIADIGAFYYDQSSSVDPSSITHHPTSFQLLQNYPNPFNSSTQIIYCLPSVEYVTLTVNNILGQRVATLFNGFQPAGIHRITWDAEHFPSGIYFCRIETQNFSQTRRLILLK